MTSLKNIAVFGATGNIGGPIITGLLERRKDFAAITAFTSSDPKNSKFDKLREKGVKVVQADFDNNQSLVDALRGQDAIILALSGGAKKFQKGIIDAAIEAGVKRVYPSEFGYDYTIPKNQIPIMQHNVELHKYLEEKAKEGKISYTLFVVGCFLDWSLVTGFFGIDLKNKTANLINGGRDELYATPTEDIARFLAASLVNSAASHNKVIRVRSYSVTAAQVLREIEKQTGAKFSVTDKTARELDAEIQQHFENKEFLPHYVKSIQALHFDGNGIYSPLDNNLFPEVKPTTWEETVKGVLAGKYDYFKIN